MKGDVLVVGGSGGIGSAICRLLAERGWRPVVGYAGHAEAAQTIARETGGEILRLDLGSEADIQAAVAAAAKSPLAGVVLAASPPPVFGPFDQIGPDQL